MSTMFFAFRRARALLVGVLAVLGLVAVGTAAAAHDVLIESDPAEGAVLDRSPEAVVLTFNNPPLEVGSAITVVDADGQTVVEGAGRVEGNDVVLDLDTELPAGDLEVRWRVASSDGHPIEGVIPFTLDLPEPVATTEPTSSPAEPASSPAEPGATAEPATVTAEATTAEDAAADDAADEEEGPGGLPTWLKVAIGIAALAAVVGLVVIVARRLRSESDV